MIRSTRITAIAGAGALVAALGMPGLALAAESAPGAARVTTSADRASASEPGGDGGPGGAAPQLMVSSASSVAGRCQGARHPTRPNPTGPTWPW